jgi:hypothetical protein
LARFSSQSEGVKGIPFVIIPHPIGGIQAEEVKTKAKGAIEDVINKIFGK